MRECSDACYNSNNNIGANTNGGDLLDAGNRFPSLTRPPLPAVSPIKAWSEDIRKFGSKRLFAEKSFSPYFAHSTTADNCADVVLYGILRDNVHNKFPSNR